MRTKWFWPPGVRLQKSPSHAHYFKKLWAYLFGHHLPDGIVRCTNLMVKTRNTWRSTCNLSDLTNRKNSLCNLMDILTSEGVECANSILPLTGERFICQLSASFNEKCFWLEKPPSESTVRVTDRHVGSFVFLFKCRFWKEILAAGKWSMRFLGHQSGVLSVSRDRRSWGILSHRGVLDPHSSSLVLCVFVSMQKQRKQLKQRLNHAEALRWPQGFFSSWQIRFPLLECSTGVQPRLVFNPVCLTWKGTSIDCFDPFNSPPCLPALQGGQHQEGSVQPSFESTPEGCKKLLLLPLS